MRIRGFGKDIAFISVAADRQPRLTVREAGGWRYSLRGWDSDISVTGWQLMALRAAKNLGCDVPTDNIERAVDFIKSCNDPNTGGYRYRPVLDPAARIIRPAHEDLFR